METKHIIFILLAIGIMYAFTMSDGYDRAEGYSSNPSIRRDHPSYGFAADSASLILFKSENCGYCKAFKPTWNKVVKNFKGKRSLNVREFDSKKHQDVMMSEGIKMFPTIRFYPRGMVGREYIEYSGDRSYDNLLMFINAHGTF